MEIQTKFHGIVKIVQENIILFENGIPGFPDEEKFLVLPLEKDGPFFILQSLKSPGLAFVIVNPFQYFPDYDFTIEDQLIEKLQIESTEDVLVYTILTVKDPFEETTANLQAPLIISLKNRLGKQVILNEDKYFTRHRILEKR